MGLIKFLKDKFGGKSQAPKDKYVAGLAKSRHNFANRLKLLSNRYQKVNEAYFEELTEILIEADVGVSLTFEIIEETRKEARLTNKDAPTDINEIIVDKMFVSYAKSGANIINEIQFQQQKPFLFHPSGHLRPFQGSDELSYQEPYLSLRDILPRPGVFL